MLARKGPGKEAKLSYHGHLMTENRSGLVVNTQVTTAYGSAECHAGLLMAEQLPGCGRVTLGADKGYDQREFVEELRCMGVTPHVAQNQGRRRSRLDQRTTRHPGYEISQRKRKRIEEVFGWMKTVGMLRQLRHRGLERVGWVFTLAAATYNLVRMRTLMLKCVQKARSGQNYTFPGEIKINTRPGQTGESATKRAEPCSIEIFQHPARRQSRRASTWFQGNSRVDELFLPRRRLMPAHVPLIQYRPPAANPSVTLRLGLAPSQEIAPLGSVHIAAKHLAEHALNGSFSGNLRRMTP